MRQNIKGLGPRAWGLLGPPTDRWALVDFLLHGQMKQLSFIPYDTEKSNHLIGTPYEVKIQNGSLDQLFSLQRPPKDPLKKGSV